MILYKGTKQLNKMENLKNFFKALLRVMTAILNVSESALDGITTLFRNHPKVTGIISAVAIFFLLCILFPAFLNFAAQLIALLIMGWLGFKVFSTKKAPTQSPRNNNRRNNNNRRR
jgi:chromate transport protein ChrA